MNIGDVIKSERKKKKITQKELAEKIGKSERMVQKYENGEVIPSIEIINNIESTLNTNILGFGEREDMLSYEVNKIELTIKLLKLYGHEVNTYGYSSSEVNAPFCDIRLSSNHKLTLTEDNFTELMNNINFLIDYELNKLAINNKRKE